VNAPKLNVLSLFAGIGGIELGLERAGMTTVGQVELDPYCLSVLAHHWPEVPRHDDVRTAPEWWTSEPRPRVDVVAGGFPCQPFSSAGLRNGTGDTRWGWPWMADVIRTVRPRYVLVENVAALVRDQAAFGWLLADLADLGFDAEWSVLRASDVGAPHRRERLFLVAHPTVSDGQDQGATAGEAPSWHQPGGSGLSTDRGARWLPEPTVDRVAYGVPRRLVHPPLHALGNAVVPQIAEHLGRLIVEDYGWREAGVAA
jgi:DNA (cytosine-5)-methyltransferase 1